MKSVKNISIYWPLISNLCFRYNEALKGDDFKEIDDDLAQEFFDFLHRIVCAEDASNSWYETSSNYRFELCEGDETLNWKDKGYKTIFDLLQVNFYSNNKNFTLQLNFLFYFLQNKIRIDEKMQQEIDILPLTHFNKTVKKLFTISLMESSRLNVKMTVFIQPIT